MKIQFTKKGEQSVLTCTRTDGSFDRSSTSRSTALHDLAHSVVGTELELAKGFYGNLVRVVPIEQLSSKEVIRQLDEEAFVAEISARALQSLYTGACTESQFCDLINQEFRLLSICLTGLLPGGTVGRLHRAYGTLMHRWNQLPDGGSMELHFVCAADKQTPLIQVFMENG